LKKEHKWTVSTSTLYRYIDRGYIPNVSNSDLPYKPYRKRKYRRVKAAAAPKGTSIERRPHEVEFRSSFGHWELDSVIGKSKGKNQSVLTLVERKTRYELVLKVPDKSALSTVKALRKTLCKFPTGTFQTITVDNGSEFADCEGMENAVKNKLTVYYCHPYSSYERGTNERYNRVLRAFLPKGTSFAKITQKDCDAIAHRMNNTPRKVLNYATPQELFTQEIKKLSS